MNKIRTRLTVFVGVASNTSARVVVYFINTCRTILTVIDLTIIDIYKRTKL